MINVLHRFQERIKNLHDFLGDAKVFDELIGTIKMSQDVENLDTKLILDQVERLQSSTINRKTKNYVSGMILLYGLFEQYVEEILMAYLEELNLLIDRFEDIPEKIRKNHANLSAQLLINREQDKYRDRFNEIEVVQRMYSCMGSGTYQLNTLAFIDHKSNFRIESLKQFFEPAGVTGISTLIKKNAKFLEHIKKEFPSGQIDNLPDTVVFKDLDDLAWRRNVIAHRWPDDMLSIDMMVERTEFIRVLGECLYEVLKNGLLPHIIKNHSHNLPNPIAVYNNSIVCFHLEDQSISLGSRIIAMSPKEKCFDGNIIKIEVDNIEQLEVVAPPAIDVACQVDFKAKKNYQYFLVQ